MGNLCSPWERFPERAGDPKDDHILELAVALEANCIVTHNIRDFNGSENFGVRIVTPGKEMVSESWLVG